MKIFLAGPLFNEMERDFNLKVAKKLRKSGFEVWLAQEAPFVKKGTKAEKKKIYEGDVAAIEESDVVVAILDGMDIDPGVAFQIGYAKGVGKKIIGLKTDYRTFSPIEEINLMLEVPLKRICGNVDDVVRTLKKL